MADMRALWLSWGHCNWHGGHSADHVSIVAGIKSINGSYREIVGGKNYIVAVMGQAF